MIGGSQPEPRSGEGCDQADHGRPVEAMISMKVFLATVSPTNGRGPRCTEADQAGIEAPVLSLQLDDPLEEEDKVWDTAMVEAVSTVMNTVEVSKQALVGGPGQKQEGGVEKKMTPTARKKERGEEAPMPRTVRGLPQTERHFCRCYACGWSC